MTIGTWPGWMQPAPMKPNCRERRTMRPEGLPVAEGRHAGDEAERHDAGGARGEDHLLLGHEQRLLGGLHAVLQREVLAADVHRRPGAALAVGDRRHLEEGGRRLDHGDEAACGPARSPRFASSRAIDLVDALQVLGALHLGDRDAVHLGADRGLEVARASSRRAG